MNLDSIYIYIVPSVFFQHENHIIHRDLKAENVFYAGPRFVKVGDFGFSTVSRPDQTLNTFCGSPPYAAPELFKDESYYGGFVDIWAIGIMIHFTVTGVMPFRADTVAKLKKCILEGNFTIPSYVSDSCQFIIRSILKPVPQDRFTLAEIRRSDWLEGQEFPEAFEAYKLNPSLDNSSLKEDEREAHNILQELGINNEHYKHLGNKASRSSITGTYRIILHKVQKKYSTAGNENSMDLEHDINRNEGKARQTQNANKQSKFCVIL